VEGFTPVSALVGGVLIGVSAAAMLVLTGRIAGISGVVGGLFRRVPGEAGWRIAFLFGLLSAGILTRAVHPRAFEDSVQRHTASLVVAGLLVGVGTSLGNGCTSGHGVCGVGRLSRRSIVATVVFMATGVLAAWICNHVLQGSV
jgi:uncharacterized membrane protein YedE/YeeE